MVAAPTASPHRDEKREAILTAALRVFVEEGYTATTMSAIAGRLGWSKGTLYNHFQSKADLFVAALESQRKHPQSHAVDVSKQDLRASLTELVGQIARGLMSDDVLAIRRIALAEAVRFPEIGQALHEAGPMQDMAHLTAHLCKAMDQNLLKRADPRQAAEQIKALALGDMYYRRLLNVGPPPTEAEIEAGVDAGVTVFMAAYSL